MPEETRMDLYIINSQWPGTLTDRYAPHHNTALEWVTLNNALDYLAVSYRTPNG